MYSIYQSVLQYKPVKQYPIEAFSDNLIDGNLKSQDIMRSMPFEERSRFLKYYLRSITTKYLCNLITSKNLFKYICLSNDASNRKSITSTYRHHDMVLLTQRYLLM